MKHGQRVRAVWRHWQPRTVRAYAGTRRRFQAKAVLSPPTSRHAAAATLRHRRWRHRPRRLTSRCRQRHHQLPTAPRAASETGYVASRASWQRRAVSFALAKARADRPSTVAKPAPAGSTECGPCRLPRQTLPRRRRRQGPGARASAPLEPPAVHGDDDVHEDHRPVRAPMTRSLDRRRTPGFRAPPRSSKRLRRRRSCRTGAPMPLPRPSRTTTDVRPPVSTGRYWYHHGRKETPTPWCGRRGP